MNCDVFYNDEYVRPLMDMGYQWPYLDNKLTIIGDQPKEIPMYTTFNSDEVAAEDLVKQNYSKQEKIALENGLIRQNKLLTEKGRNLLLQILFEDKEINKKFYDTVENLYGDN